MTVATAYSTEMAIVTGNVGGVAQALPTVSLVGGRKRAFVATIALASQASGSIFAVARLPAGAIITEISVITDTSLGSATIAFGDTNSSALYGAAQTLTATQTPTRIGLAATTGVAITTNLYDSTTGLLGKSYEDVVMTVATAALPASGTLKVITEYVMD